MQTTTHAHRAATCNALGLAVLVVLAAPAAAAGGTLFSFVNPTGHDAGVVVDGKLRCRAAGDAKHVTECTFRADCPKAPADKSSTCVAAKLAPGHHQLAVTTLGQTVTRSFAIRLLPQIPKAKLPRTIDYGEQCGLKPGAAKPVLWCAGDP